MSIESPPMFSNQINSGLLEENSELTMTSGNPSELKSFVITLRGKKLELLVVIIFFSEKIPPPKFLCQATSTRLLHTISIWPSRSISKNATELP